MRFLLAFLLFPCAAVASAPYLQVTVVDDGDGNIVGEYSSVAIAEDGNPVISYYDSTARALKVARCEDPWCGAATITTVDDHATLIEGRYSAIAIGQDGFPVISYQGGTGDTVKVAKCTSADCSTSTITVIDDPPTIGGTFTSIAVGPAGRPIVSYTDDGLKVARCADADCGGGASVTLVDPAPAAGYHTSIAIAADGRPIVSYREGIGSDGVLKVVKCNNPGCTNAQTPVVLDDVGVTGSWTSIAVRNNGIPMISYHDETNGALKIARCVDEDCSDAVTATLLDVDDTVGLYSDIAIGLGGRSLVSHHDETTGALMLTACLTANCAAGTVTVVLDAAAAGDEPLGLHGSIAIGADALPVVSYFDAEAGALKLARCGAPLCDGVFRDDFEPASP